MSGSAAVAELKCARCLLQQRVCLCAEIPTVVTRTRIVIVRHHREQHRSSNTARLAHFALPNSEIVDHGVPEPAGGGGVTRLPDLSGAWLLYPVGEPFEVAPAVPPTQLVVLDASWSQARKMYRKVPGIRGLPILRLPDVGMAEARLRASPGPGQVSTIEAIAAALRLLEGEAAAAPLERLFGVAVARAQAMGRRDRP